MWLFFINIDIASISTRVDIDRLTSHTTFATMGEFDSMSHGSATQLLAMIGVVS